MVARGLKLQIAEWADVRRGLQVLRTANLPPANGVLVDHDGSDPSVVRTAAGGAAQAFSPHQPKYGKTQPIVE